ncbi:MAG TPA: NUDIX domain-containing protein [Terriglobales bacterium]|jgi:8-oxo-dGTP diphosphatase|nr:NUDIX domain-containing protein [Terriglobales bacterium]
MKFVFYFVSSRGARTFTIKSHLNAIPIFGTRAEGIVYTYRPSAYAVIRNGAGEFAIARTPLACYLLGGGMEPGETPEQTIEREAKEECGLVLRPSALIGRAVEICYSAAEDSHFEKDSVFKAADVLDRVPPIEVDHELTWLKFPLAMETLTHGSHRWAIERFQELSGA